MFADSHAHLEMGEFDSDRPEVIARAVEAGVELIVTVGTTLEDCRKVVALAAEYKEIYAAVGVHPHHAREIEKDTYQEISNLARMEKVVAYGEIGLDFFHNLSPRNIQITRFGEQLELASDLDLPVIVHSRDAHREVLEMLTPWRGRLRGILHCFSGDYHMARRCLDLGFYISLPGTVTFQKADIIREVVSFIHLEGTLLETDCPYLAPQPFRGKRNEPAYVVHTAQAVADILETTLELVGETTLANTREIFRIVK
ncbi:MAG: TatD family hydrolase [Smithellaceae bacterium]|nr:TatD family hydrolase [Smithellaceae bacterium]